MKRLAILGSTGSVGQQTLDVVRCFQEEFQVVGLAAGSNVELLMQQAREFSPQVVSFDSDSSQDIALPDGCRVVPVEEMVARPDVDMVVMAIVGCAGLSPTMRAIQAGKPIVLASKEALVMAGEFLSQEVQLHGVPILPVDSEPSAIWQCLQGEEREVSRVIITASGGAFRGRDLQDLEGVTPQQALQHPTWRMGRKITIDSATLVNKAFEVIETHWLFGVPWERIEVVIHPQSIIHSMVEFVDGSVKAQLGPPDMRLPIQYALFYPERRFNATLTRFDPLASSPLTFEPLDLRQYPCFAQALDAGKRGGTWPAVVAAADDMAVDLFLQGRVGFLDIYHVVERVLEQHQPVMAPSMKDVLEADAWARSAALGVVG